MNKFIMLILVFFQRFFEALLDHPEKLELLESDLGTQKLRDISKIYQEINTTLRDYVNLVEARIKEIETLKVNSLNETKVEQQEEEDSLEDEFHFKNLENENATNSYDISQRLLLHQKFTETEPIVSFNLMNFRTLSKTETGIMSNILVLIGLKNKVKIYDIFGMLLFEQIVPDGEIKDILTFHINEEYNFYVFTKNNLVIKYRLDYRNKRVAPDSRVQDYTNTSLIVEPKPVKVRTYKESIHSFEVSYPYEKTLMKITFDLQKESKIELSNSNSLVSTSLFKGHRMIAIKNDNKQFSILTDAMTFKDINVNFPKNSTLSKEFFPIDYDYHYMFQGYVLFVKNNVLLISNSENVAIKQLSCEFVDELIGVFFDSYNYLIYVILKRGTLLMMSPKFSSVSGNQSQKMGYCEIMHKIDLSINKTVEKRFLKLEIIRKEILIYDGEKLIILDISNYENSKDIPIKYIDFESFDKHSMNYLDDQGNWHIHSHSQGQTHSQLEVKSSKREFNNFQFVKTSYGNLILIPNADDKELSILNLLHVTNKYLGNEDNSSLNFKVPVIVLAIAGILFYQYYTRKKASSDEEKKKEIIKLLQENGVPLSKLRPQQGDGRDVFDFQQNERNSERGKQANQVNQKYERYLENNNQDESEVYTEDPEEDILNYGEGLNELNQRLKDIK